MEIVSSQVGKLNPATQLLINASVTLKTTGTSVWTLNDTSITLAPPTSLSSVTQTLPSGMSYVLLIMSANSLSAGTTLAFTLSSTGLGGLTSSATVIIAVNAPPSPGVFAVSPRSGAQLTTPFTFSASQWDDPDLPLQYSFGYLSATGSYIETGSITQNSYGTYRLPAGQDTSGFNVSCVALVYDSFRASSMIKLSITVKKVPITQAALLSLVSASISDPAIIGVAASIANAVSCTGGFLSVKPLEVCAKLNRNPCSSTTDTCGKCLSGFSGTRRDSNSKCVANVISTFQQFATGSVCTVAAGCSGFDECDPGTLVCTTPSQGCPNNCSGNGVCLYLSVNTRHRQSVCNEGDPLCTAECSCTTGFVGDTCNTTTAVFLGKQKLRDVLTQGLLTVIKSKDADLNTVTGWAISALSLSLKPGMCVGGYIFDIYMHI